MRPDSFCDLFPPRQISDERKREIESELHEAAALVRTHKKSCGFNSHSSFYSAFLKGFRPGVAFDLGGVHITAEDAEKMMCAKRVEEEVLSGFSRMIQKCIVFASRRLGGDQSDLHAEVYEAALSCMITYDKSVSSLSTYLNVCLSRKLLSSRRGHMKVPRAVRAMASRVRGLMEQEGVSLDSAVESLKLSPKNQAKVLAAMSKVRTATDLEIDAATLAVCEEDARSAGVLKIVQGVRLGTLEKAVLQGFLNAPAGSMGLSEGGRGLVNPQTGRPYSRAALSCAWKEARKKLAAALKEVA